MDVHIAVLKLAESWQSAIVADWKQQDFIREDIPTDARINIRNTAFDWLAAIICLYWAEGRELLPFGGLRALSIEVDTSQQLALFWRKFCERFGQKPLLQLENSLAPKSSLIQAIIDSLYCSNLEQTQLSINILGMLYEANLSFFDGYFKSVLENSHQKQNIQSTDSKSLNHRNKFRKSNGIYYTPQSLVEFAVEQTLDCYFAHSSDPSSTDYPIPQILDPTCGGGAFLLTAYQHLLDRYLDYQLSVWADTANPRLQPNQFHQLQLSFNERQRILSAIHGVDLDPQAVTVTQVSLWLKLIETIPSFDGNDVSSVPFVHSISVHCGNALTTIDHQSNHSSDVGFQWQTAFPQQIAAGFDIVIGNPPYIDAEQMTANLPAWRSYCTAHYQTATGNWDLFCVFIEKSLQLCREGGFTSLVVPNKLLSANYASAARQLLSQNRIISIRDYSQVSVFEASVYPIVYTAQKVTGCNELTLPDKKQNTIYEQMQTLDQVGETYQISLHWKTRNAQPWLVGQCSAVKLMQRLEHLPKLEAVAQVLGAATVAEAYLLKDLIQEKAIPAERDFRLINSGTIDRYVMQWGQKPLRYLKQSYYHPVVSEASLNQFSFKRLTQAKQPKIIVAGMSQRLECAFDAAGAILAGKSTSIVLSIQAAIDLRYLLALLNSRLASFYVLNCFQGNRLQGGYLRIGAPQLRQIPIVLPNSQPHQQNWYRQLIHLVDQRLAITDDEQSQQDIDQEIDVLVYALYQLDDTEIATVVNDPQLLAIHR